MTRLTLGVTRSLGLALCSRALHLLPRSQTHPQLGGAGLLSHSHRTDTLLSSSSPRQLNPLTPQTCFTPFWLRGRAEFLKENNCTRPRKTVFPHALASSQPGSSSLSSLVSFLIILIMREDNCFSAAALALVCDSHSAASHPKQLCCSKKNSNLSLQLPNLD